MSSTHNGKQVESRNNLLPAEGETVPGQCRHPPVLDSLVHLRKERIENAGPHLAFLLLAGASDQTRVVGVVAKHPMTVTAQKP